METGDVERFYALYEATGGQPGADALQAYIDEGSAGLHTLADRRNVTGQRIRDAMTARPGIYEKARECAAVLPRVRSRVEHALSTFSEIYRGMQPSTVTIVVARGKPVGIGSSDTGIQIGLEALCAADFLNANIEDRFVHVIAHEYVHAQQSADLTRRIEGNTPTVLEVSLSEGIAEFIGELISGDVAYGSLRGAASGRILEIERGWYAERHSTDLTNWVYNSSPGNPGDLGYWVGYRVAKSYYQSAPDKRAAIASMVRMSDPEAFLENSGWQPGIRLQ